MKCIKNCELYNKLTFCDFDIKAPWEQGMCEDKQNAAGLYI